MKYKLRSFILTFAFFQIFTASSGQCFDKNFAFKEGEIIRYQAYYNWGFIWLNAGYIEFKVKEASYLTRPVYHLDAFGATHKSYEWIYKVNDHFESYLDKQTLLPLWFNQATYEGGYKANNRYFFDYIKKKAYLNTENSNQPFKKDTLNLPSCTFDLISVVYYCRNLNFSKLKIGDTIPIKSIIDDQFFNLYIRYLGKEKIKNRDDIEYNCIKFSALLVEGTIFKGGEDMFIWVTDDMNRIPILVEAKILIGSVKAYFENAEGLRYPVQKQMN
jgi:hypothetical protein